MTEQNTPKMTHDEMIDVLKGLVFGTFDRTTAKEREALDMAISALSAPSANVISIDQANAMIKSYVSHYEENKGEWIPVSERLPKIADVYRVTRYYPNNVMNPRYLVDACAFDGSNTWYDDNRINHERAYVNNIIAWQENPEPYKADMRGE